MRRHCDGTDPNLIRQVSLGEFNAASEPMTISKWAFLVQPGMVMVTCQCGRVFDDVARLVIYPHEPV